MAWASPDPLDPDGAPEVSSTSDLGFVVISARRMLLCVCAADSVAGSATNHADDILQAATQLGHVTTVTDDTPGLEVKRLADRRRP